MNGDSVFGNVELFGDERAATRGQLRGAPDFEFAVLILGAAVARFERGVGNERILVGRFQHFRGTLQTVIDVAIVLQRSTWLLLRELLRAFGESDAALVGGGTFVPLHDQLLTRGVCLPPGIGHNGNAGFKTRIAFDDRACLHGGIDHERMLHTRQFADLVNVRAGHFAAKDWAFVIDRVEHARHGEIDTEDGLAGDDIGHVDGMCGLADDFEIALIFELERFQIGHGHARGSGSEFAVTFGTIGAFVINAAVGGETFGFGDTPGFGSGRDQHLTRGCAHLAHRYPIIRSGAAAARCLHAVLGVEIGLFHLHRFPIDFQLFGNQHGQHGLNALSDFGVARDEGYRTVGRNFYEGGGF